VLFNLTTTELELIREVGQPSLDELFKRLEIFGGWLIRNTDGEEMGHEVWIPKCHTVDYGASPEQDQHTASGCLAMQCFTSHGHPV